LDEEALELETRKKVYDIVRRFPGLHLREISRQAGMSATLTEYHLNFMEKVGLVSQLNDGQYTRYYPRDRVGTGAVTDTLSPDDKKIMAMLRQRIPFQVVLYLLKNGSARHGELVPLMGVSASTLSHHLNKLVRRGIITKTRSGEDRGYRLTDEYRIARLLMDYRPPPGSIVDGFLEIWEELRR